jgi:hypothetical protein
MLKLLTVEMPKKMFVIANPKCILGHKFRRRASREKNNIFAFQIKSDLPHSCPARRRNPARVEYVHDCKRGAPSSTYVHTYIHTYIHMYKRLIYTQVISGANPTTLEFASTTPALYVVGESVFQIRRKYFYFKTQ